MEVEVEMWLSFVIRHHDSKYKRVEFIHHEGRVVPVKYSFWSDKVWFKKMPRNLRERGIETLVLIADDGSYVDTQHSLAGSWKHFRWKWRWSTWRVDGTKKDSRQNKR